MKMMRSVSFVDRIELDFQGNHFSHAITLGDVDSDGLNELVIGNVDGMLAVFKGDQPKPWRRCSGLGTITCVGVGDVFNNGKNSLVCITAESSCHIFTIEPESSLPPASSDHQKPASRSLKPVHTQHLEIPNVKDLLIANIAPAGSIELFVGCTDRCVGAYQWSPETHALQCSQKWSLSGQVGSLSLTTTTTGTLQLLVSQPGGTYIPLSYDSVPKDSVAKGSTGSPRSSPSAKRKQRTKPGAVTLDQLSAVGVPIKRNPTASTEVVGQLRCQSSCSYLEEGGGSRVVESSNVIALCTLDGCVRMLQNEKKQWELQVDHSLFAIDKLDVTGSGEDEIVVCAWDGMTYIVDQKRNVVRYQFEENVSAFCAGFYGFFSGENKSCLVYTTFSNKIYLYHNVILPAIPPSNLLLTMKSLELPEELKEQLGLLTDKKKQELFYECLYALL